MKTKAIRNAAKGQPCTLNIAGVCNYDAATTVLAHFPDETHGWAKKSDDISAGFACSKCHNVIDMREKIDGQWLSHGEKEFYMRRSQIRTLRALIEMGIIEIHG